MFVKALRCILMLKDLSTVALADVLCVCVLLYGNTEAIVDKIDSVNVLKCKNGL